MKTTLSATAILTAVLAAGCTGQPAPPDAAPATSAAAVPKDPGNQVRFLDAATADRVRRMTITLPAWPDQGLRPYCPAGRYTFTDGEAPTGGSEEPPGRGPWTYLVLFKGLRGIFANVDGQPGDEIVFPIGCGDIENVFHLLVIQPDGNRMKALGYVGNRTQIPAHDRFYPQGGDLVVEVNSDEMHQGIEQRRRFHWQGSRFAQVGGPTSFPTSTDVREADLRNGSIGLTDLTREPGTNANFGASLSFVDGVSGMWAFRSEEFVHPGADFLLGAVSTGQLAEPADFQASDALVTLTCRWDDGGVDHFVYKVSGVSAGGVVVRAGVDGVTGIVSHRIVDGLAEVTVTTAVGQEIRRYRSNGYVFAREN
jgi:hypothetical protein